jgi:5-methyltetrahydrofolate--homocysteine methyltransferase
MKKEEEGMSTTDLIETIKLNIIQGRVNSDDEGFDEGYEGQPATVELIEEAVKGGTDLRELVLNGLTAGMNVVGDNFEKGKYLIPDMLASAEAVGEAMDILAPHLEKSGVESKGKIIMATVKGDLHDIGKNIVSIMLKGAGFNIIDLGTDVPTEKIVEAAKEHKPKFIGLSALLTTTMREMGNVIEVLKAEGMRKDVTVMIGGAPTSKEFAQEIGADAFCLDAFQAVSYAASV